MDNNTDKKGPARRPQKIIAGIIRTAGTLVLAALVIACAPLTVPRLVGYQIYSVVSGSMEPAIPVGSLVYIKAVEPAGLETDDVIAFYGARDSASIITHRIVENRVLMGEFITKGDANQTEDMNPVPYADVVTTTTHKTLRGPRGGLILCKAELAQKIDKAIFPGTQGGPLEHIIAAKAVCFGEALQPEFKAYQQQVVKNAKAFAAAMLERGFDLVSGGTDNHLCLIDLRNFNVTGKDFEHQLDEVYITANKNSIPNDPQRPSVTSGIRVGTPAVTTRGFVEEDMVQIAEFMYLIAKDFEGNAEKVREGVNALCAKYPLYE